MALTDNIISYWKLEGNSNDSVSTNNGTDTSITYSTANGKIDQGAGFNGTSSKISVADAVALTPAGSFSYNFWVNVTSYNTNQIVLWAGKWDETGNNREYAIGQEADNLNLRAYYAADGSYGTGSVSIGFARPAIDGWHMLTYVFTSGSQLQVYLDGVSQGTAATADTALADGTSPFLLGNSPAFGGASNFFNGKIDEVGLWSRVLTGAEITELYNSGAGLAYPFTSTTFIPRIMMS